MIALLRTSLLAAMVLVAAAACPVHAADAGPEMFRKEQAMSPAQLIKRWNPVVIKASKRFHVPVLWINAVMRLESGGRTMLNERQRMISDKGALGLMQVLPQTYGEMRDQHGLGPDPHNPTSNINAGTAYLAWLQRKYGFPAMFAAYNAGPGRVEDLLSRGVPLPAETRSYLAGIDKILGGGSGPDGTLVQAASLTRPDGVAVLIDPVAVTSVRAASPGEYAPGVVSVISLGRLKQGVREDLDTTIRAIRIRGGRI